MLKNTLNLTVDTSYASVFCAGLELMLSAICIVCSHYQVMGRNQSFNIMQHETEAPSPPVDKVISNLFFSNCNSHYLLHG